MPVMLPEMRLGQSHGDPGIDRAAWNAQADRTGQVGQSTQSVVTNLVALEAIQAAGVSLPLAPAKAFEWRLAAGDETASHQQARQELQLLLLAQFVGLVKQVRYSLNQPNLLSKVLRAEAAGDEMVLWLPLQRSEALPSVLAGSLAPAFPLFPSTSIQLVAGREALRQWLLDNSKGQLNLVGNELRFSDAAQASRFRLRISDLLQQSEVISRQGPWYQSLQRLAAI